LSHACVGMSELARTRFARTANMPTLSRGAWHPVGMPPARTQSIHGLLRERARESIFRVKSRQSCSVSISSSHVIRFIVSG